MDDSKMDGNSCKNASRETHPILGDLTNLPSKRGISSVLADLFFKSGEGYNKSAVHEGAGVEFSKRLCLVVDDLVKEKSKASAENECKKSSSSSSNDKNSVEALPMNDDTRDITAIDGTESEKIKDALDVLDACSQSTKRDSDTIVPMITEDGNGLRDSVLVPTCSESGKKDCGQELKMPCNAPQSDIMEEGFISCGFSDQTERHDGLDKSDCKTIECPKLPNSQSSRSFEISKCLVINGNERANHNVGAELLNSCSCSFCLKAAYIWSDLQYQDIKGRIAVLKKSQKEASLLLQKSTRGRQIDSHGLASSHKSSKLELDLMAQWRSLFLNTEDILGRESNQLQSSFVSMKDLRESYKTDLEKFAGQHQDKS